MQPQQRSANAQQPEPAWEMVRRWPGMRGEDKLAWLYLWQRSRGGREQIDVTPNDVAADQNVSSDAGRQRFKNLAAAGLILIVRTDRTTGLRTIEMPSPRDVSRARRIEWDGQFEFEFMDSRSLSPKVTSDEGEPSSATSGAEPTGSACAPADDEDMDVRRFPAVGYAEPLFRNRTEVPRSSSEEVPEAHRNRTEEPRFASEEPPEVPRFEAKNDRGSRARVLSPSVEITSLPSVTFETPLTSTSTLGDARGENEPRRRRGSPGGSSPRSSASRFGLTPGEQALIDQIVDHIQRKVGCPNLRLLPCVKAAKAVLCGKISRHDLEELLDCTARKKRDRTLRSPASAYFNGGLKMIFQRYDVDEDSL